VWQTLPHVVVSLAKTNKLDPAPHTVVRVVPAVARVVPAVELTHTVVVTVNVLKPVAPSPIIKMGLALVVNVATCLPLLVRGTRTCLLLLNTLNAPSFG
jgi:hypothetical protein